jgi:hypothetical protein
MVHPLRKHMSPGTGKGMAVRNLVRSTRNQAPERGSSVSTEIASYCCWGARGMRAWSIMAFHYLNWGEELSRMWAFNHRWNSLSLWLCLFVFLCVCHSLSLSLSLQVSSLPLLSLSKYRNYK